MIDYDKITSDLKRKIMGAILEKAMDAGNVGPESIDIRIPVNKEEIEASENLNLPPTCWWEIYKDSTGESVLHAICKKVE